jgi:hypothetical protein
MTDAYTPLQLDIARAFRELWPNPASTWEGGILGELRRRFPDATEGDLFAGHQAMRQEVGREIDPKTAETRSWFAETMEPYGVFAVSDEQQQLGQSYFVRAPGSNIWVCSCDLPEATYKALFERVRHQGEARETFEDKGEVPF